MMACVHAGIGAALGSRMRSRRAAFAAGAASHLIADLFPHRDYTLPVEVPLLLVALAAIGTRYGIDSPEMAGALGGIAPDVENGFEALGLTSGTLFPTHTTRRWFIGHGRRAATPWPQIAIVAICAGILESSRTPPS